MSFKFVLLVILLFIIVGFGVHWATNSPEPVVPVVEQQMDELDRLEEELKKEEE